MTANTLYGITHDIETGAEINRVPRTIKVGIGRPAGPDLHVWIDQKEQWAVEVGSKGQDGKRLAAIHRFPTKEEAQTFYRDQRTKAQALGYPMKVAYFTFTRPVGDGTLEPDWGAIERHGPLPTVIDIMFLSEDPWHAAYQLWSATGLQCFGDGKDALRAITMDAGNQAAAQAAKSAGSKRFPILDGCAKRGCPYAQATVDRGREVGAQCKPHGRLEFQLLNDLRFGAKSQFDTTGEVSIGQISSFMLLLGRFTGGAVSGIPIHMRLQPFRTNHNGKPGKAYAASLEVRAENMGALRQKFLEAGEQFRSALQIVAPASEARQLSAPTEAETPEPSDEDAGVLVAEFYPDALPLDESPTEESEPDDSSPASEPATESRQAQVATQQATDSLRDKLAARRKQPQGAQADSPSPLSTGQQPVFAKKQPGQAPAPPPPPQQTEDLF